MAIMRIIIDANKPIEFKTAAESHGAHLIYLIYRPFIQISANFYQFCEGTEVTCTAVTWFTGIHTPHYQWYLNDVLQLGETNSTLVTSSLAEADIVYCDLTDTPYGRIQSNTIKFRITDKVTPSITISCSPIGHVTPELVFCVGDTVLFSSTCTNQGPNPSYQWYTYVKDAWVAIYEETGSSMLYAPVDGQQFMCVLTSDMECVTASEVNSNVITMVMSPYYAVSVTLSAVPTGAVCERTEVTYTAQGTNGGATPAFAWYVNDSIQSGQTSSSFVYSPVNGDVIKVRYTSSYRCKTGSPAYAQTVASVTATCAVDIEIESYPASVWAEDQD